MKTRLFQLILFNTGLFLTLINTCGQPALPVVSRDSRAVIVVTGMTIKKDTRGEIRDLSVAEGATVRVIDRNGKIRERNTEPFPQPGDRENEIYCFADFSLYSEQKDVVDRIKKGEIFYTADFDINLDSTYRISIKFNSGSEVTIDNYMIPASWRTHFYYHWTNGLKSPASVLRIAEDPKTKLRCCVYALFPLDSYRKFGGSQVSW